MPPRLVSNPPNPWLSTHVDWLEEPPVAELQVFEEEAKSALTENDSPDVGFRWSVNPYRGCWHACAYCFARPNHQFLGFGAGTDFERKIVVKINVAEVLARQLARPRWKRELVIFSGNTDCYQPLEASYQLTRRCLQACAAHATPVAMITKSALVRRDIDVLVDLTRRAGARVNFSIPFLSDEIGRKVEPGAASPSKRFEAMRALSDAGIATGIGIAPLIPGLNDSDVPGLLERARDAGATSAFLTPVRLSAEVLPVFRERLHEQFPERASKVENAIREMRGGRMNQSQYGLRMQGEGERWKTVEQLFDLTCRNLGLRDAHDSIVKPAPPPRARQGELFG